MPAAGRSTPSGLQVHTRDPDRPPRIGFRKPHQFFGKRLSRSATGRSNNSRLGFARIGKLSQIAILTGNAARNEHLTPILRQALNLRVTSANATQPRNLFLSERSSSISARAFHVAHAEKAARQCYGTVAIRPEAPSYPRGSHQPNRPTFRFIVLITRRVFQKLPN